MVLPLAALNARITLVIIIIADTLLKTNTVKVVNSHLYSISISNVGTYTVEKCLVSLQYLPMF
jgi:hypothetical protein